MSSLWTASTAICLQWTTSSAERGQDFQKHISANQCFSYVLIFHGKWSANAFLLLFNTIFIETIESFPLSNSLPRRARDKVRFSNNCLEFCLCQLNSIWYCIEFQDKYGTKSKMYFLDLGAGPDLVCWIGHSRGKIPFQWSLLPYELWLPVLCPCLISPSYSI